MNPSNLDQLIARLQEIAPQVWQAALSQVAINARAVLVWAGLWLLLAAGCLILALWCQRKYQRPHDHYDDPTGWVVLAAFGWFGVAGLTLIALANVTDYIKTISNPEWAAIQLLLQQLSVK